MEFTRNLKKGMSGADVRYIKDLLFDLGYYEPRLKVITLNSYGNDTVKAVKKFQTEFGLEVDGIVGPITWGKILEKAGQEIPKTEKKWPLHRGDSGEDVWYIKNLLFKYGFYTASVKSIKNKSFGADTYNAVKKFQLEVGLPATGEIDEKTWAVIELYKPAEKPRVEPDGTLLASYTHIEKKKRDKIEADLVNTSDIRREICLEILNYCHDKDVAGEPRALYLFGANLYNTDLKINYATAAQIEKLAKRNPSYFDGGRKEWMLEQVKKNPKLPASDCSGQEVGYLRKHKLVSSGFDANANRLCSDSHSKAINKSDLQPGDWVGKDSHVGTYVGGGYVVEFYGGAFTCALTDLNSRKAYNFITKKISSANAWTKFRRPKYY